MYSFSKQDLKKHLDTFNDLKCQIYITNELFFILGNFCDIMHPVYKQFTQNDSTPRPDIIIQQFYNCCVKKKEGDLFLYDYKNPQKLAIHTSNSMIATLCAGAAAIIEDEELSHLKTTTSKQEYIHNILPQILPEIYNGSIIRFNQLIELTRKTLFDVAAKDMVEKTNLKIGIIQNELKQNKAKIFHQAEQMGLIPSADILTQYQQARDIIFAHPGKHPTNGLSLSNTSIYTNKKGEMIRFNSNYFDTINILENYEKIFAKMLNIPQDKVSCCLPDITPLSTNTIEAGISIDYLERNRQLQKNIIPTPPTHQDKEAEQDITLRNQLEHAQETSQTLAHLKNRQSVLFNKNKELTLKWLFDLLSHQHDS